MDNTRKKPLVTLAIISYNQEKYIEDAVTSALLQTYEPMEVVISDDCSTDNTFHLICEIVARYKGAHRVVMHQNKKNCGLAANLNMVLSLSKGSIVCWAAGDDVSLPGKIEALVTPLIEDPSLSATHSYVNEIDADGNFLGIRRPSVPKLIKSPEQVIANSIEVISQSHGFRRSVYEKFGPLNDAVTNESAVMAFRESCLGNILLIERPLTEYRIGVGVSTSRGRTIEELSVTEPLKYATWWASAYEQIAIDSLAVELSPKLRRVLRRRVDFYRKRFEINSIPMNLLVLFSAMFSKGFLDILTAFVRRNAPLTVLRYIYRRRGWIN